MTSLCACLSLFTPVKGATLRRSPTTSLALPKYTSCNIFLILPSMSSISLPALHTWLVDRGEEVFGQIGDQRGDGVEVVCYGQRGEAA